MQTETCGSPGSATVEPLAQPRLADPHVEPLALLHTPVLAPARGVVHAQRALVALLGVDERLLAARRAQRLLGGAQQCPSDALAPHARVRVEELELAAPGERESDHLAVDRSYERRLGSLEPRVGVDLLEPIHRPDVCERDPR